MGRRSGPRSSHARDPQAYVRPQDDLTIQRGTFETECPGFIGEGADNPEAQRVVQTTQCAASSPPLACTDARVFRDNRRYIASAQSGKYKL